MKSVVPEKWNDIKNIDDYFKKAESYGFEKLKIFEDDDFLNELHKEVKLRQALFRDDEKKSNQGSLF